MPLPKLWNITRELAEMPAETPITAGRLRAEMDALVTHYGETVVRVRDLEEGLDKQVAKESSDYRAIQQVQSQLRAAQDQDRNMLFASMADLKTDLVDMKKADEDARKKTDDMLKAALKKLDTVQDWTVRHDGWHEGVKEGKHDTGETIEVVRAVTERGDKAEGIMSKIPWDKVITALVTAALTALGISIGGCNHAWTPAEEHLVDTGTSAVTECLALPLTQCMWGGGATGYKVCLRNAVVPCLVQRAQEAAGAGLAVLWERYSVRLQGVYPGAAGDVRGGEVMRCIDAIDADLVADQCPAGKAPRLCVVDAVRFCGQRGEEAGISPQAP